MKPVKFSLQNTIYAEGQDEYLALPAHRNEDGVVTTCWKMTWREKLRVLWTGEVYLQTLTFGGSLQPQLLHAENPLGKINVIVPGS